MKKYLSLALALAMMVSTLALASCGDDSQETTKAPAQSGNVTTKAPDESKPTESDPAGSEGNTDPSTPAPGSSNAAAAGTYESLFHPYEEIENLDAYKASHVNLMEEYFDTMLASHSIFSGFDYTDNESEIPEAGTNEMAPNLFDGSVDTKWCCGSADVQFASAIVWQMTEKVNVTGYTLTTANDNASYTDRNPATWRLYGANTLPEARMDDTDDSGNTYFDLTTVPEGWTLIDAVDATDPEDMVSSLIPDLNFFEVGVEAAHPGQYQYFMLLIDYIEGGTFQMSEFTLYGTEG